MKGVAKVGPSQGEKRQKTIMPIDVTIAIFFDGTDNNKNNTDLKNSLSTKDQQTYLENTNKDHTSSYDNDYSNIARLWKNYSEQKGRYKLYVEGIATTDSNKDDSTGNATGSGKAGIPDKVQKGCKLVADKLNTLFGTQPNKIVNTLTIDIFGFSRGAAAARNFIYEITKPSHTIYGMENDYILPKAGALGTLFREHGIEITNMPIIRFAGLFDCVASYSEGIVTDFFVPSTLSEDKLSNDDTPDQFKNDTTQLHLDAIAKAQRIIHFTAADEHRGNFPLTNIESAGKKGSTFPLPGVHSDIGGSYPDKFLEKNTILIDKTQNDLSKEKERLESEAWFKENELVIKLTNYGHGEVIGSLSGKRTINNSYSFIPLHFMCQFATEFTKNSNNPIPLDLDKIKTDKATSINSDALLTKIRDRLYKQVFENASPLIFKYYAEVYKEHNEKMDDKKSPESISELQDQSNLRLLRHGYLHWNTNYDEVEVMGLGYIHPMYPRLVNGTRQRLPIPG